MNEKEVIEEIAKAICGACNDGIATCKKKPCSLAIEEATAVFNLGYRKIPEGSVVLSMEEFDEDYVTKQDRDYWKNKTEILGNKLKQARKETAKEFALKVKECKEIKELVELGYIVSYIDLCKEIDELAEQYEVEE